MVKLLQVFSGTFLAIALVFATDVGLTQHSGERKARHQRIAIGAAVLGLMLAIAAFAARS